MKGLKNNIDKSQNFNFQNLIFSHFVRFNIAIKRIPHTFPWLCAWDVVTSYSVTYCIYILGKPGFCFHNYCADYDEFKYSETFWLADLIRLFVHNTISLSSLCKLIWRNWTYKMPVRCILSSVWVRLSIFFQLFSSFSYPLYNIWGCVFSVCPSPLWWLK